MRSQLVTAQFSIETHLEIDALVSEVVMEEKPTVFWQDADGGFCFENLDEALDAIRDPMMRGYLPESHCRNAVIEEVREFRPYSTTLSAAWEVVEHLREFPLRLCREGDEWSASFGDRVEVYGHSPALAICLAALQLKGVHVSFESPN